MIRECSLEDISDGKLYELNDMVRASCNDCRGCSKCCSGMGQSIILDPLDIFRISSHLNKSFEELLKYEIELNIVDGIILPNLKMIGEKEQCSFLNSEGRCSIHEFRPGMCRIFPLGRIYQEESFKYFLQTKECPMPNKTKVKVSKWIDTPELEKNQKYISDWHYFLKNVQENISDFDEVQQKSINMRILNMFYIKNFDNRRDFYIQFSERLRSIIG